MNRAVTRVAAIAALLASLASLLHLITATPASAAESLQMAVRPGFAGAAKLGTWVPVEVELQNAGPELVGEVQVQVEGQTNRGSFSRPPATYSVPVTLPSRARKRVSVDVFVPSLDDKVSAQFVANGQTLVKQPVNYERITASELSCGVWAGNPTGLDFLTTLDPGGPQRRIRLAHLDPADIPSSPLLLQSLDCLILTNVSTSGLSGRQKDAIQRWVDSGGLLVVGGGPGVQKTVGSLPPELLPVKVSGSIPIRSLGKLADYAGSPLPERGPWLVGDAVTTDGVTLVEENGLPLLVTGRRGLGAVIYLGLDPTAEPLRSWDGGESLWRHMLSNAPAPQPGVNNLARQYTSWGRLPRLALADLTGSTRTSSAWLLYLLLGYAAAVGPTNYLFLRRFGKLEWSVVTVPAVTAIAVGAALAGARANPASDLVVNNLAVVRSWDGKSALAHSYVGLFSLRDQSPDLSLPEGGLAQPLYFPFPNESSSQGQVSGQAQGTSQSQSKPPDWEFDVRQGEPRSTTRLALRPGALGTYAVDQLYELPGTVGGSLTADETSVRGSVVSKLNRQLRDASLVVGGDVVRLGDLRAGESRSVDLRLQATAVDVTAVVRQIYPTTAEEAPKEEAALRDIIQSAFSAAAAPGTAYYGYGPRVELGPATLVGWLDESPLGEPGTSRAKPLQRTLLISSVPLRPQPGLAMQVPTALIVRRALLSSGTPRLQGTSISLSSGDAISWEYQLPFDQSRFSVEELRFDVAGTSQNPSAPGTLRNFGQASLYDWQRAEWAPVELDFGQNVQADPQRFVSSLGLVRFRYTFRASSGSPSSMTSRAGASFSRFDLVVKGTTR